MVFDTLHAVGLENAAGVEILIHIGLDTPVIITNSDDFSTLETMAEGSVNTGDPLLKVK